MCKKHAIKRNRTSAISDRLNARSWMRMSSKAGEKSCRFQQTGAYRWAITMTDQDMTGLDDPRLLARLVELRATVNSTPEPDQLLRSILTAATELLEFETASLLTYNPSRGALSFISAPEPH